MPTGVYKRTEEQSKKQAEFARKLGWANRGKKHSIQFKEALCVSCHRTTFFNGTKVQNDYH